MTSYDLPPGAGWSVEEVSERFRRFAESECRDYSPLYERLCYGIAADREVMELTLATRAGQPLPNMLFAAVHYLLLRGEEHPLARHYPSLTEAPPGPEDPWLHFRDFCLSRRQEVRSLLASRLVQTNEVGRSAVLMPGFRLAWERGGRVPLALVEVGASAGLNLLFDRFHYEYEGGPSVGDPRSAVRLRCRLEGALVPPVAEGPPPVAYRAGIDLNPVDARDEDTCLWLRALVWPEHRERALNLRGALDLARREPPRLLGGDALELLPEVLPSVPTGLTLCVFHSITLHQFPPEARRRFSELLLAHARKRPLWRVWMESTPGEALTAEAGLAEPDGDRWRQTPLGRAHPHGAWLRWEGPTA